MAVPASSTSPRWQNSLLSPPLSHPEVQLWSDESNALCRSCTVKHISKFHGDQIMPPLSLCPKEALGRVWRRKALPLEDCLNCFRAGRWWWCCCCCMVSSLMITLWATGVWEVQFGIHLRATAEWFHWDLKKNAMQAESLWIHHHTKRVHFLNGASCCVNAKWGDGSSSRQWRCFHMHDSAAFFHFSFRYPYSCLCLRLW